MAKVKDALCSEYGDFDVTLDRDKYIGGSDIPAILGLSKFTTRWQLLLEKAGLEPRAFSGNRYTEYGHAIEPKVRNHINLTYSTCFYPNRVIDGDIRYHADGFNGACVLEIKSTSDIHATVDGYKPYLVQLLKGMEENQVENGILAVYHRPEDMSAVFDGNRLQVFDIHMDDHRPLLAHINRELDRFREDLKRLKENPLLSEQDFLPAGSLVQLAEKVARLDRQIAALKEAETQCRQAKESLYREMLKHNMKSFTTVSGAKITRVDEIPADTKKAREFDVKALQAEQPAIYSRYCREVEKKTPGRSGYVRITVPR